MQRQLQDAVEGKRDRQAELTFKAGCLCINRVYRFFNDDIHSQPSELLPDNNPLEDPVRADFEATCDALAQGGIGLCPDRAESWKQYGELRGRYATALEFLGRLMMAPEVKPV